MPRRDVEAQERLKRIAVVRVRRSFYWKKEPLGLLVVLCRPRAIQEHLKGRQSIASSLGYCLCRFYTSWSNVPAQTWNPIPTQNSTLRTFTAHTHIQNGWTTKPGPHRLPWPWRRRYALFLQSTILYTWTPWSAYCGYRKYTRATIVESCSYCD